MVGCLLLLWAGAAEMLRQFALPAATVRLRQPPTVACLFRLVHHQDRPLASAVVLAALRAIRAAIALPDTMHSPRPVPAPLPDEHVQRVIADLQRI